MDNQHENPHAARGASRPLRLLLVEDNRDIAGNIYDALERVGHSVDYAESAEHAVDLLEAHRFDVLIVDVMLPRQDGIELCNSIRSQSLSRAPVLMLTARTDVDDKLLAFNAGADDYVTKPFSMAELLARVEVLGRRGAVQHGSLEVGDLVLDVANHRACRGGTELKLTRIGLQLLTVLVRASPAIVLRDDMEQAVWGEDRPRSDALRTHMSMLRRELDRPFDYAMIQTVHGAGWRLLGRNLT